MRTPSVTLGRPLGAALVLGGLLLAAVAAGAASWAGLGAARDERDAKAELLQRSVDASRRARVGPAASLADPFVPGETATLAAAAVEADLRSLAADAGLALLSSRADIQPGGTGQPGEPGAGGIGTRIAGQAVLEGDNAALQALLVRLEGGAPLLLVDSVALQSADGAEADPQEPRLRLSLTISAYWRPARAAGR